MAITITENIARGQSLIVRFLAYKQVTPHNKISLGQAKRVFGDLAVNLAVHISFLIGKAEE